MLAKWLAAAYIAAWKGDAMEICPLTFEPIYKDKIWGGRNLARLLGRRLPLGQEIGESWELADIPEGVSVVAGGPAAGATLTQVVGELGERLLGKAKPLEGGRFPLLLKYLDANDMLSLQVHPDARAVREIGGDARLKTECWYVLESREGIIYKGVKEGVTPEQFSRAIEDNTVAELCRRHDVKAGGFHYLPAGTAHALGAGVVVAEIQTPSDTTYRVSDWGRGRELHIDLAMKSIHFGEGEIAPPGADAAKFALLQTEFFSVFLRTAGRSEPKGLPAGVCCAVMLVGGQGPVKFTHEGPAEPVVWANIGDTVLLPAALKNPRIESRYQFDYLEIVL